jgi:hypothetical protein
MIKRRNWEPKKLSPRDEADYMSELMLKEHTAEMLKCMDDPYYFFTTYCTIDNESSTLTREKFEAMVKNGPE